MLVVRGEHEWWVGVDAACSGCRLVYVGKIGRNVFSWRRLSVVAITMVRLCGPVGEQTCMISGFVGILLGVVLSIFSFP